VKRILCLILCAVLLLCLFPGCHEQKDPYVPTGNGLAGNDGGSVVTPPVQELERATLVYDPQATLNPYQCMSYVNRTLFSLLYQGLFAVDREYRVSPILCESYNVSADMKTYTFYVADALFSDGTALTAEDVAASLKAAQTSPWYGGRLRHVSDVRVYGDAVMVELSIPLENLPLLLDVPVVKASQVQHDAPMGSGPYRLNGNQLRHQAGWWCSSAISISADTIELVEGATPAQVRDCFELLNASLVCTDPSDIDQVDYHSDYELWDCENGLFVYLACNSASEIFSNDAVRAALTHAIDRDMLTEEHYRGFARSALLPASPQFPHYDDILASNYRYAPEQFRNALKDAGLEGSEVVLLVNGDDAIRVKVAEAIAEMLEKCGLVVTIRESTTKDFAADLQNAVKDKKATYDLYLAQTRLSPNMDLSAFFGTDTALNYGGLSRPGIYAVSLEALANHGNYYTLYEMIMDDGLLCPLLFQSYAIYGQRGALGRLEPARDAVLYYDLGRTMEDALITE
jgi:ABC-type transport system substrate-binding protein